MTPSQKGSVIERSGRQEPSPPSDPSSASKPAGQPGGGEDDRESASPACSLPGETVNGVVGEGVPLQERLIVSPCEGRFQPEASPDKANGEYVLKGQQVGRVISSDGEEVPVTAAFSGWIVGYLVPQGFPIRAAEPVAWLRPH